MTDDPHPFDTIPSHIEDECDVCQSVAAIVWGCVLIGIAIGIGLALGDLAVWIWSALKELL